MDTNENSTEKELESSSEKIATDMVVRVSSKKSERKKSTEKFLDSETTTVSTSEKNSPKQNEKAVNEDIVTKDTEHNPPQNTTDVPTRVSSRIFERKKRALNKLLESQVTNSTTSDETNSKEKEGSAKKNIVSYDEEETPPQTTADQPTKVSSRISERKKRAFDESCESTSETSTASEEENPEQKENPVKRDILTENVESSSELEEVITEDEDDIKDSKVDKPRRNVTIKIGDKLEKVLEHDMDLINNKNKLIVLPAQPTVISILESWVLEHTTTLIEKMSSKRHRNSEAQGIIDETIINVNLCREMADGIRVYFDHTLAGLLLYAVERDQCNSMMLKPIESTIIKHKSSSPKKNYEDEENETEIEKVSIKTSTMRSSCLVSMKEPETAKSVQETKQKTETVSSLTKTRSKSPQEEPKSSESLDETKQRTENMSGSASTSSKTSSTPGLTLRSFSSPINSTLVNDFTEKAKIWRLVKDDKIKSSMPSNIYGAIHLVRLFVRLPDLLARSDLTKAKLKVVLKYIRMFLSFMGSHEEWFGEQFYMLNTSFEESNTDQ